MEPKQSFFNRISTWIKNHKFWSIVILAAFALVIYFIVKTATPSASTTTYVIGSASTGTIVSTITGTGQISTSSSLSISPKISGTLSSIRVKPGDSVKKGQTLFVLDSLDAQKQLRDAKLALATALASQNNSTTNDSISVQTAYQNLLSSGLEAIASDQTTSAFNAPTISGNYTLGKEGTITIQTYSSQGGISFQTSGLVDAVGLTSSVTPTPIGNSGLSVLFPTKINPGLTWTVAIPNKNSSSYTSNYNTYQSALRTQATDNETNGSSALSLEAKQNAVDDAQDNLNDCYVTAPFDGIVASIPVVDGQNVSTGTTLGTVVTNQQVATITLNEVDVAKVAMGDKVTLTFDAVSGLTITGTVSEIDTVGTVSSGVVNYTVKISLDTQDSRIKSGMSVTADIASAVAQNVVTVPSSAIKTSNGASYVLTVPNNTALSTGNTGVELSTTPTQTTVETGISDDMNTEIKSGLSDGDKIVTKTIIATTSKTATSTTPSILGGSPTRSAASATRGTMGAGGFGR